MDPVWQEASELLAQIGACEDDARYRELRDQLYGLGPAIVELLRAELGAPSARRRMAAATNLARLGDLQSVPALIAALGDAQSGVREMALFGLGILGDASACDAIARMMADYDADVRYRALVALGDLGYPELEAVLARALGDESYGVREQALSQLRAHATPHSIVPILRALLEREVEMQRMAEEALDRLVPRLTREHYKKIQDELTARERRLLLNYMEARNFQEVWVALFSRLQLAAAQRPAQRGLDKYGRLLHAPEERPYLERAWGRDEIVSMLVEHFRDPELHKSVLLVGPAGSGKTAIVHELVHRLGERASEEWQIIETNTSELISGTRYLGDWETKLKEMAEAILKHERVILYLTNPGDLLGAGAHSKSDENFADFFKPYLQRGQLRMIAECSEDDIKGGLSRDPGFLRQFRQIAIRPMSDAETISVVERRAARRGAGRGREVRLGPGVAERVVDFARSFYTRTESPGRACDLYDALIEYAARRAPPDAEVVALDVTQIPPALSEASGVSLDLLDDTVRLDLSETEAWFGERLLDQPGAIRAIVDRLAMIKAGVTDPGRPLGVHFLVGPTGVGKTYLAKLTAERLFGDPKRVARFDLSEYRGRFALERLIGSPHDKDREGLLTEAVRAEPFCVLLFDEFEKADPDIFPLFLQILDEGRLTDAAGRLADFRQTIIFLTSNLGASRGSIAPLGIHAGAELERRDRFSGSIQRKLDEFFAPEFLNRLDEILVFTPLSPRAMRRLVAIELKAALARRGLERRGVEVQISEEASSWLAERGFSERFGARELKRTIAREVLAPLARFLVDADPGPARLTLERDNDELRFSRAPGPGAPAPRPTPRPPERGVVD